MILQLTDFQGHFRLPNAPQQDLLAAVREADLSLLRELFAEETVAFIAAPPNDPPASTLRSGGGGLLFPWRDAALWYAQYRIAFGIAGQGIPAAEGTERRVAWYAQVVSST
ncbi:MAG: hypothetical protein N3E49_09610, partial [Bacteroidia bacterium]|nr:hypothetical protein [Bacteroidia bacterium]